MNDRLRTAQVAGISIAIGLIVGGVLTALAITSSGQSETEMFAGSMMMDEDDFSNMGAGMGMMSNDEFDFLVDMIPHHQEAIDNAQLLVDHSVRPDMREFGATIITAQSAEIKQMEAWLAQWYPDRDTTSDYQPMMGDLAQLRGDELDERFLETMIPHHMIAVMMSQQLASGDFAEHEEVVPFAANIRDVQRAEIYQMRQWLTDWFDGSYRYGPGMGGTHHMRGAT